MSNKITMQAQFSAVTLLLTPSALLFLNGMTKGIPHLTIYIDLLFSMATTESSFNKRGIDVHLKPLEVEASANGLGDKWNLGRKVMTRLLGEMEELGLLKPIRSAPLKLTSIAAISAVTDWLPLEQSTFNETKENASADHQNYELPTQVQIEDASLSNEKEANDLNDMSPVTILKPLAKVIENNIKEDASSKTLEKPDDSDSAHYVSGSLFEDKY